MSRPSWSVLLAPVCAVALTTALIDSVRANHVYLAALGIVGGVGGATILSSLYATTRFVLRNHWCPHLPDINHLWSPLGVGCSLGSLDWHVGARLRCIVAGPRGVKREFAGPFNTGWFLFEKGERIKLGVGDIFRDDPPPGRYKFTFKMDYPTPTGGREVTVGKKWLRVKP